MPPRIIQWQPVDALDELLLVPRADAHDAFARRAAELGLPVDMTSAQIYAPGTNIDGGYIDVGDPAPVARLRDGSVEDLARAAAELVDVTLPTRFLVSDYDGWRAIHTGDDVAIADVASWQQHLADEGEDDLLVHVVTEPIAARANVARPEELHDLEELVRLAPSVAEPYALLARLYLALGRTADAERAARALLALDVRDYRKAPARTVLGELASARGDHALALEEHRAALKLHHTVPAQLAVGVAALRANEPALAKATLASRLRARTLFELAESLCSLGRLDAARAYLEVSLDLDRDLLAPVPENQWPKPPATGWTEAHPALAAIVDAARAAGGRHG